MSAGFRFAEHHRKATVRPSEHSQQRGWLQTLLLSIAGIGAAAAIALGATGAVVPMIGILLLTAIISGLALGTQKKDLFV